MKHVSLVVLSFMVMGCNPPSEKIEPAKSNTGSAAQSESILDVVRSTAESKEIQEASYDLMGTIFGVSMPRQSCAKDSVYWVVSKKAYSNCLNMAKDFPDYFGTPAKESADEFNNKCVGIENLPEELAINFKNTFILQKNIAPCSETDSASLAKIFGSKNVSRDPDDGSSCRIVDSIAIVDSSLPSSKLEAKKLGERLPINPSSVQSGALDEKDFQFSPFTISFVPFACKEKSAIDSITRKNDSRFLIFRIRNK